MNRGAPGPALKPKSAPGTTEAALVGFLDSIGECDRLQKRGACNRSSASGRPRVASAILPRRAQDRLVTRARSRASGPARRRTIWMISPPAGEGRTGEGSNGNPCGRGRPSARCSRAPSSTCGTVGRGEHRRLRTVWRGPARRRPRRRSARRRAAHDRPPAGRRARARLGPLRGCARGRAEPGDRRRHRRRIGTVTDQAGHLAVPSSGVAGTRGGLRTA
jgi:hypothetical protein